MIEKKLLPRKEATISEKEVFLKTIQDLVDMLQDDRFQSEFGSLIEDMAKENDICIHCFTKIDEVLYEEGLFKKCNCKSKLISKEKIYQEAV